MKTPTCPKCKLDGTFRPKVRRSGSYYRTSDSKTVQRFQCDRCRSGFSASIFDPYYRKRERRKSALVFNLLASGVSQRRIAEILKLNRKTVVRTFLIEAQQAEVRLFERNKLRPTISVVQFDDLETFEHTKCKPLSVTLAVEEESRTILGFQVSRMPARGPLAAFALGKYGFRADERRQAREKLLTDIKCFVAPDVLFKSDQNPHYPSSLKKIFPGSPHKRFKGKRGSDTGQGEIKKVKFDPLFSLNHTCAMFRANVNRLIRKTWCTTKKPERLYAHLMIYADYHNAKIWEAEREAKSTGMGAS
jgi:transposase-like protein